MEENGLVWNPSNLNNYNRPIFRIPLCKIDLQKCGCISIINGKQTITIDALGYQKPFTFENPLNERYFVFAPA